jgi:MYXO-CTERM domain-containing protein
VSFGVQENGSELRGITYEQANQVVTDAFRQWRFAPCPEGGMPSIDISDAGKITCNSPEYNQDAPNANVIMFADNWPYTAEDLLPGDTLALTTVTFNVETGEIYDADVEVNSQDASSLEIDSAAVGDGDIDLHSVLTHEIGHFLGLSHTTVSRATMSPSLSDGETDLATLDPDDIAGICSIYPPERETTTSSCTPRHGFSTDCAPDQSGGCCSVAPGARPSQHDALALALAGLGIALLAARRRS